MSSSSGAHAYFRRRIVRGAARFVEPPIAEVAGLLATSSTWTYDPGSIRTARGCGQSRRMSAVSARSAATELGAPIALGPSARSSASRGSGCRQQRGRSGPPPSRVRAGAFRRTVDVPDGARTCAFHQADRRPAAAADVATVHRLPACRPDQARRSVGQRLEAWRDASVGRYARPRDRSRAGARLSTSRTSRTSRDARRAEFVHE